MKLIENMTIRLEDNGKGTAQGTIKINGYEAIKTVDFNEKMTMSDEEIQYITRQFLHGKI